MNEIQSAVFALLPPKRKTTPSGWISFNSVCCHHRGEHADKRQRGGIITSSTGGFQYSCFNCNFKTGWSPGKLLSTNARLLFKWLGMSESDIGRLNLIALKIKDSTPVTQLALNFELQDRKLPNNCHSITQWILDGCADSKMSAVVEYITNRGMGWDWYDWHWSPEEGYSDRVILPFYHNKRIVGWTGRKIVDGKPKYLTDAQPGYVFNMDSQLTDRAYVIVVEGQFDAIAIDGVAIMHNDPNEMQIARINSLSREVIVVPDRDRPGAQLLKSAIANNWSVSLPPWGDDIKDVSDAVKRYGRLYVLSTILHYRTDNKIKIQLIKKRLESIND